MTGEFVVVCISCMYYTVYLACQELFECLRKIISSLSPLFWWWSGAPQIINARLHTVIQPVTSQTFNVLLSENNHREADLRGQSAHILACSRRSISSEEPKQMTSGKKVMVSLSSPDPPRSRTRPVPLRLAPTNRDPGRGYPHLSSQGKCSSIDLHNSKEPNCLILG